MKKFIRITSFLIGISSVFVLATGSMSDSKTTSGATVSSQDLQDVCLYTVQKGDTLSRIALHLTGKTGNYKQIMGFNGLTSDMIRPNDQLNIPKQLLLKEYQCSAETPPPKESEHKILAEIEGIVFEDKNENGRYDSADPGIPGVKVVLIKGREYQSSEKNGVLIRGRVCQISDEKGKFFFVHVESGEQAVGLYETSLPDGYRLTTDSTVIVSLTEGDKGFVEFGIRVDR